MFYLCPLPGRSLGISHCALGILAKTLSFSKREEGIDGILLCCLGKKEHFLIEIQCKIIPSTSYIYLLNTFLVKYFSVYLLNTWSPGFQRLHLKNWGVHCFARISLPTGSSSFSVWLKPPIPSLPCKLAQVTEKAGLILKVNLILLNYRNMLRSHQTCSDKVQVIYFLHVFSTKCLNVKLNVYLKSHY